MKLLKVTVDDQEWPGLGLLVGTKLISDIR